MILEMKNCKEQGNSKGKELNLFTWKMIWFMSGWVILKSKFLIAMEVEIHRSISEWVPEVYFGLFRLKRERENWCWADYRSWYDQCGYEQRWIYILFAQGWSWSLEKLIYVSQYLNYIFYILNYMKKGGPKLENSRMTTTSKTNPVVKKVTKISVNE